MGRLSDFRMSLKNRMPGIAKRNLGSERFRGIVKLVRNGFPLPQGKTMDDERIDSIARAMAGLQDRRSLMRGAVLVIAAVLPMQRRRVLAQDDCGGQCPQGQQCQRGICITPCANDRDCRSKKDDPCILNTCINGICIQAIADCLAGYECCRGECCPKRCGVDAECAVARSLPIGRVR